MTKEKPESILWLQPDAMNAIRRKMSFGAYGVYVDLMHRAADRNGRIARDEWLDIIRQELGKDDFFEELELLAEIEATSEITIKDGIIELRAFVDNRIVPDFDDFE